MGIKRKSAEQIEKMRSAGSLVCEVLDLCRQSCQPGMTTLEIDEVAYQYYMARGARGLFKNYPTYQPDEGFPSNLCISVNDSVVHGIADSTVIKNGDLVSIDCGVELNGWCGDAATTVMVGEVEPEHQRLCEVTMRVLRLAIDNIKPGRLWSQIARMMQGYAEQAGMSVVREFVGHGIGRTMHEDPKVPNFVGQDLLKHDIVLREGMVLAIEPMCNLGSKDVKTLDDGWTVKTVDGRPSAHYEHTVAVTENGADVLTNGK